MFCKKGFVKLSLQIRISRNFLSVICIKARPGNKESTASGKVADEVSMLLCSRTKTIKTFRFSRVIRNVLVVMYIKETLQ